ncbi:S9 family peptidase [Corynebacterium confusum]|uniref:S9 family peptidase n=1 Tax=uncultured Corynebacterium sp. TaxID=159447 RepID=UPI0025EC2AF0|nr:S9 family peptidase [uncultured Corynebacterium sp.]
MTDESMHAPGAPVRPISRQFHGRTFVDDYEWLRDKKSQDTLDYLNAENDYTKAQTAHLETLTENIYQEIKSRIKETDMSVPVRQGDYWYYGRSQEGKSYGLSCRLPVEEGADPWFPPVIPEEGRPADEEVLLDLNELAEGNEFFSLGASSITTSGRYLAYSVDVSGDERFELRIKDLATGELLDDHLTGLFYGATWVGEDYIFYQTVDEAWRADSVWRHKVGTPQEDDVRIFYEEDAHFSVGVGGTRSDKYLFLVSSSKITSEFWVLEQDQPEGEFQLLWERESGVEYEVDHAVIDGEDRWIVTHNAAGANFEVTVCPALTKDTGLPALRDTQVLVPHREDVRIEGVDTYQHQLVLVYRSGGIGRIAIMPLTEGEGLGEFTQVDFDEEIYTAGTTGNPEWDTPVIRMVYGSFTQPAQVLQYDVATGERTLLKQQEVQGGYEPGDYIAYRLWATAQDGTEIPVSVVHRADLDTSAPQPMLLYGYGSYETSVDPGFSVTRLSLLDRGMIFAVAHVRGGGEMGRGWYDHGKLMEKKNTFTDFIDVADDLIARGLTSPDQLAAEGGSAGGMLMGAVANMAPDRFTAIQAAVPFVDPLTSMLMPELPLTVVEWDEWGDPYHDPAFYDYMASYAPYENVTAQDYPNILATTSLNDTRVLYVEPAKWIAKLRTVASGGQFLLKTEMVAGHGGVSGRYDKWRQNAFEYAWIINQATGCTE